MNQRSRHAVRRSLCRGIGAVVLCLGMLRGGGTIVAAQAGVGPDASKAELERQVNAMESSLRAAQKQIEEDHAELEELRRQLNALKHQVNPGEGVEGAPAAAESGEPAAALQRAVAELQERQALQQAEIQVHEQEKVETASKYALKVHGLVLFNASVNDGAPDSATIPNVALSASTGAPNGSLTATGRQTLLGLDSTGPKLWGAQTYASLSLDFAGGSSSTYSGSNALRLRTAAMQMVWPQTTVEAGVEPLILSPNYATSYFSIAEPALSWSGALWGWLPQVSVEQRIDLGEKQRLTVQAAIADIPDAGMNAGGGYGVVSAAEHSRYPGSEGRIGWERRSGRSSTVGVGGYWSPHSYAATATSDGWKFNAWAGTADWKLELPVRLQLSGSVYRGAALGGLSGGAFKDTFSVYMDTNMGAGTRMAALRDEGGWAQLKFKPQERLQFNVAFGEDEASGRQLRYADLDPTSVYAGLARNQTTLANIIFRPRSAIVISGEFRAIRTWRILGPVSVANLFGLAAGYEF